MAQPRFVPITITVDAGQATPKVTGLKNAFDDLDSGGRKASSGGLRNAFESSRLLRSELTTVGTQIPVVGRLFNGLSFDLVRFARNSNQVSQEMRNLQSGYKTFQTMLSSVGRGKSPVAGELLKDFGIDTEKALRQPKQAFVQFISEFQKFPDAAGRARIAADVFGAGAVKLLPQLEAVTAEEAAMATQTNLAGASMLGVLGPIALLVAALAAIGAGVVLVAKGLFDWASSSAKSTVEVDNLAKKTEFGTKTIAGLAAIAGSAGVPVGSLSSSLGEFQKNIEHVRESIGTGQENKGLSRAFKSLKIDITDNETALRSAFQTLAQMPQGYQRVAAAQRIFGGSSEEILTIIDRTNGNIDEAIDKYHDLGALLGGDALRTARQFTDQQNLLNQQFEVVKTTIAVEFMPVIIDMMTRISDWLSTNREEWKGWGEGIAWALQGVVNRPEFKLIEKFLSWVATSGGSTEPASNADSYQYDATAAGTDPESRRLQGLAKTLPKQNLDLGLVSDRAAHRGSDPAQAAKRIAELQLKATLDGLKLEDDAIDRSLAKREIDYWDYSVRIEDVERRRNLAVLSSLITEQKAANELRDANAKRIATAQIDGRLTEENNRHSEAQLKLADKIKASTRERIYLASTLEERQQTRPRFALPETAIAREAELLKTQLDNLDREIASRRNLQLDDQFVEQRRLLLAKHEQLDVEQEIRNVQDDIATGPYNQALRLQLAYYEAIHGVQMRNEEALVRSVQNQVLLAHQMDVDFNRLNDGVVDFLAHQKTLQETFQDARTNTVRTFFDGIDSAIDRVTKHLGVARSVLGTFLKDLLHLAESRLLQRVLGIGTQANTGTAGVSPASGGGGGILNFLNFLRPSGGGGGGGSFSTSGLTGGFAGGAGAGGYFGGGNITNGQTASASALSGIFGGGGITAPPSLSAAPGSFAQLVSGGLPGGVGAGGSASSGAATGIFGSSGLAAMLPLLGAGLGGGLGQGSTAGSILGMAGGGLLGLAVMGALPASMGGLGFGLAALMGPAAIIGGAALIAAVILAKNAQRRKEEKIRNEISNNTGTEIWKLIGEARSLGTAASMSRWNEIANNYQTQIAQIKDGKTKRNAQLQWTNDFLPLLAIVKQRAKEGDQAKAFSSAFVPTFAGGSDLSGLVPYRGGMQTLIKVRPGERIDDVGTMKSWHVPGIDYGRDSVYTVATPGSAVRTRQQQARIPGFAAGSNAPLTGRSDGPITVQVSITNSIGKQESSEVFITGAKSSDGRKVIVETMDNDHRTKGMDGNLGTIAIGLTKRT